MEEKTVFFEKSENLKLLNKFLSQIQMIHVEDEFQKTRNQHIVNIFEFIARNPREWDESCQINIKWIGSSLINRISADDIESKERVDEIFSHCFRFLLELYLSVKGDLTRELEAARQFAVNRTDEFSLSSKEHINYALKEMPIAIFKSIANSDSIKSIKDFNEVHNRAKEEKEKWEASFANKEQRVLALEKSLIKYESAFNFVGLFEGFDRLSSDKLKEKNNLLFWLRVFGILILCPLCFEIYFLISHANDIDKINTSITLSLIPIISVVALLIYFFRIILQNYKSTKSHILQIELRKTLCRFIQNYSEYSSEIKSKDKDALAKFENIIFSGIVSDDEKLLSTFDGIEQLGNFIKSVKQT